MATSQHVLSLNIKPQPDDVTCGPTCLHALYNYYQDPVDIKQVIAEVQQLKSSGTLAVYLGIHALKRVYQAKIYTYNLHIFDPVWFTKGINLADKLQEQVAVKRDPEIRQPTTAYLQYLDLGEKIQYAELTTRLLKKYLIRQVNGIYGYAAGLLQK